MTPEEERITWFWTLVEFKAEPKVAADALVAAYGREMAHEIACEMQRQMVERGWL
jgi:hypothetical protein